MRTIATPVGHMVGRTSHASQMRAMQQPRRPTNIMCVASTSSSSPDATVSKILSLTKGTTIATVPDEVNNLCSMLEGTNAAQQPAHAAIEVAQGTWRVVCAPHIKTLAGVLGATIDPVQYTMKGDELTINVKLVHPLGTLWLNAAATCQAADGDASSLALKFTRYWCDVGAEALRAEAPTGADGKPWDGVVNAIGLLAFVVDSTTYPVTFVDQRLAVFRFEMLNTRIAIAKQ